MRKIERGCEGCREKVRARYRTLIDQYLCEACFEVWCRVGALPVPAWPMMGDPTR